MMEIWQSSHQFFAVLTLRGKIESRTWAKISRQLTSPSTILGSSVAKFTFLVMTFWLVTDVTFLIEYLSEPY